jgi:hypothetical protein
MSPIPVFIPMPVDSLEVTGRIQQLESALSLSLGLFQKLTERLEARLGPGFLGEELQRLASAGATAPDEVRAINDLLKQNQVPAATRRLHELTAITWDQAHVVVARWPSFSFEQKVRMIQVGQWVQALSAQSVELTSADNRNT